MLQSLELISRLAMEPKQLQFIEILKQKTKTIGLLLYILENMMQLKILKLSLRIFMWIYSIQLQAGVGFIPS